MGDGCTGDVADDCPGDVVGDELVVGRQGANGIVDGCCALAGVENESCEDGAGDALLCADVFATTMRSAPAETMRAAMVLNIDRSP